MAAWFQNIGRRIYQRKIPILLSLGAILILIFNDAFGHSEPFIIFSMIYFALILFLLLRWIFRESKTILKLKKEKKQAELLHLKSQVSPHFFFNTLNNLYGMVDQDTDKAQELILKLSDMMRYSIYEGQKDFVTLGEEIEYLQNYIELHRMRYHKTIEVKFHLDVADPTIKIMPLLFIILLENAFKHGVENLRSDAFVHLSMIADHQSIHFSIENNFDNEAEGKDQGIGLSNLSRRLILSYPDRHKLLTEHSDNIFKAKLDIAL